MKHLLAFIVIILGLNTAFAVQPDEILADKALEQRARAISAELRCLVCQNQSIDESDAPLAKDLRVLVREQLKSGASDAAIKTYLVQRYGEFILLKPSFSAANLALWLFPLGCLALVCLYLLMRRNRHSAENESSALSSEEAATLDDLLRNR